MAALTLDTLQYREMYNLAICKLRSCIAGLTHTPSVPIQKNDFFSFLLLCKVPINMLKASTIKNQYFFKSFNDNQVQEDIHKVLVISNRALKSIIY